jgi:hypothetical protein
LFFFLIRDKATKPIFIYPQIMEMSSPGAGIRPALPEGACCFPALFRAWGGADVLDPPNHAAVCSHLNQATHDL